MGFNDVAPYFYASSFVKLAINDQAIFSECLRKRGL